MIAFGREPCVAQRELVADQAGEQRASCPVMNCGEAARMRRAQLDARARAVVEVQQRRAPAERSRARRASVARPVRRCCPRPRSGRRGSACEATVVFRGLRASSVRESDVTSSSSCFLSSRHTRPPYVPGGGFPRQSGRVSRYWAASLTAASPRDAEEDQADAGRTGCRRSPGRSGWSTTSRCSTSRPGDEEPEALRCPAEGLDARDDAAQRIRWRHLLHDRDRAGRGRDGRDAHHDEQADVHPDRGRDRVEVPGEHRDRTEEPGSPSRPALAARTGG